MRILKEETVKNLLAVSTRPAELGGYSLGFNAPVEDTVDGWFGHGGAWGTNCQVNYHKKELRMWIVQRAAGKEPWKAQMNKAADKFFKQSYDQSGISAYTGRTE